MNDINCDICDIPIKRLDEKITIEFANERRDFVPLENSYVCFKCNHRLRTVVSTVIETLKEKHDLSHWSIDKNLYGVLKCFYDGGT